MRKLVEYTLVSIDGVFAGPRISGFLDYRDDAYMRDGLGQLSACEAMLMGRTTYENFATIWPGRAHPWADRLNAIKKYVFSSTLATADWNNFAGSGQLLFREGQTAKMKLVATKSFSNIVKLTYEPQYD